MKYSKTVVIETNVRSFDVRFTRRRLLLVLPSAENAS